MTYPPPRSVYVLLRDDATIAGIKRDAFNPPRGSEEWTVERYVSIDVLLSDLRDENGLFDSAIGSAISDQRTVGGGIVATARAVRERLAEYFTTVASEDK